MNFHGQWWADRAIKLKEMEDEIEAARPEKDEVAAPAARISRRGWLMIVLAVVLVLLAVILLNVL